MKKAAIIFTSGKVSKISFDKVTCVKVNTDVPPDDEDDEIRKVKLSIFYEKSGNVEILSNDETSVVDTLAVLLLTNDSNQYVKFTDSINGSVVLVPLNLATVSAIEFSNK